MKIYKIFLVVTMLFLTSCGMTTKKQNVSDIKGTKSLAIIGFIAEFPKSPLTSTGSFYHSKEADKMYDQIALKLGQVTKGQALSAQKIKTDNAYIAAYKSTMSGFQNKDLRYLMQRKVYQVEGIMDKDSMRLLGTEGRSQLMAALGVEALVTVTVDTRLGGFSIFGIGPRKPNTSIFLTMYKKGVSDPVWFETFQGENGQAIGYTQYINESQLMKEATVSFGQALNKIKLD